MALPFDRASFRREVEAELVGNILPFWIRHVADAEAGGFHGAVTNDLHVRDDVPRSAVLCSRVLWAYSAAYRRLGREDCLSMARRAYESLCRAFWDPEYGGLYWEVDRSGKPVADRKHHYAQAFGVFGLVEYYRATGEGESLALAVRAFELLEKHGYDRLHGGYIEGRSRDWGDAADWRLSKRDMNAPKSMNTQLHILEAYTALRRAWTDDRLAVQHRLLLEAFLEHVVDERTGHLGLFFDHDWRSLCAGVSFGHEIEASWLLCEAADVHGDKTLRGRTREAAVTLAEIVLREGVDADGSVFSDRTADGRIDRTKAWWPQAEAVVGFYNAFEITGEEEFARAAWRCWEFIQAKMIDRTHGDWFKELRPDGTPDAARFKAGPWDCPYHQVRACLEMVDRLAGGSGGRPGLETP